MPIANGIIDPKCAECIEASDNLINVWASESGHSPEHMTINIITANAQLGKQYPVMATLYLPSLWSSSSVSALQTGLAKALSACFALPLSQIHVVTSLVSSGMVVEDGQEQRW